ncbi:nucleotidyltransferase [Sporolactobacillus nakayamae]|uniref:tRNA(Met) cytidine acetate ligase n=1 Tax=Sporolactobacillus nakayamae TaxID=269670 RepID=A0A1I2RGD8_9BACL|nr:nucleotidyltransferase [Sporolactobacillus nakayamae]SFG39123.1 Predicted nucleotidyltransferase [Sporolactobacillus nakayamae]
MIIAGIIAEYNPFHNGHLYQLETMREQIRPDVVVVVVSGDFLQRGEPALVSKWARTRMALQAGVDLVVELPYVFAVGKADVFARGAVAILNRLGVNRLFFGSECGRIEPFLNTFSLINENQEVYDTQLAQAMARGISYPNAHAAAYRFISKKHTQELVDLTLPNNSLAFQYIRAIHQCDSDMIPMTLRRKQSEHNDQSFTKNAPIASASSIRLHLLKGQSLFEIADKLPEYVIAELNSVKEAHDFASWERFFPFLKYKLLSSSSKQLAQIYEMEEGIEHRLLSSIRVSRSFNEFISLVKTKRYTWARLQRLAAHTLTNTLKEQAKQIALHGEPDSIRLLGMNLKGQAYLADIRKKVEIPLLSKIRIHRSMMLDIDVKASQIYDYLTNTNHLPMNFTETSHPPIRYDEKNRRFLNE